MPQPPEVPRIARKTGFDIWIISTWFSASAALPCPWPFANSVVPAVWSMSRIEGSWPPSITILTRELEPLVVLLDLCIDPNFQGHEACSNPCKLLTEWEKPTPLLSPLMPLPCRKGMNPGECRNAWLWKQKTSKSAPCLSMALLKAPNMLNPCVPGSFHLVEVQLAVSQFPLKRRLVEGFYMPLSLKKCPLWKLWLTGTVWCHAVTVNHGHDLPSDTQMLVLKHCSTQVTWPLASIPTVLTWPVWWPD